MSTPIFEVEKINNNRKQKKKKQIRNRIGPNEMDSCLRLGFSLYIYSHFHPTYYCNKDILWFQPFYFGRPFITCVRSCLGPPRPSPCHCALPHSSCVWRRYLLTGWASAGYLFVDIVWWRLMPLGSHSVAAACHYGCLRKYSLTIMVAIIQKIVSSV